MHMRIVCKVDEPRIVWFGSRPPFWICVVHGSGVKILSRETQLIATTRQEDAASK